MAYKGLLIDIFYQNNHSLYLHQVNTCMPWSFVLIHSHYILDMMYKYCSLVLACNRDLLLDKGGGIRGTVVARRTAGQQVERSICARGMIHNKLHLIRPGCLQPSTALTEQIRGLKYQSFIVHSISWILCVIK